MNFLQPLVAKHCLEKKLVWIREYLAINRWWLIFVQTNGPIIFSINEVVTFGSLWWVMLSYPHHPEVIRCTKQTRIQWLILAFKMNPSIWKESNSVSVDAQIYKNR